MKRFSFYPRRYAVVFVSSHAIPLYPFYYLHNFFFFLYTPRRWPICTFLSFYIFYTHRAPKNVFPMYVQSTTRCCSITTKSKRLQNFPRIQFNLTNFNPLNGFDAKSPKTFLFKIIYRKKKFSSVESFVLM